MLHILATVTSQSATKQGLPTVIYVLAVIIPICVITLISTIFFLRRHRKHSPFTDNSFDTEADPMLPGTTTPGSSIQEFIDFSNSGSGGGEQVFAIYCLTRCTLVEISCNGSAAEVCIRSLHSIFYAAL